MLRSIFQRSFSVRTPIRLHTVTPTLPVPLHIPRPDYAQQRKGNAGTAVDPSLKVHECILTTPDDIDKMRIACKLASEVREYAGKCIEQAVNDNITFTTDDLDKKVHSFIVSKNAYPACLGYAGFPKSICTSINEVIVHGIPDMRPLKIGDIVNVDLVVYTNGFFGDCSGTFKVGRVSDEAEQLIKVTKESLDKAIQICGPKVPFSRIADVIQTHVEKYGYTVCPNFGGHGLGKSIHLPPVIHHDRAYVPGGVMEKGMVFTIEPAINQGSPKILHLDDGWTVTTEDGSLSAQFEEAIMITEDGYEILTNHK